MKAREELRLVTDFDELRAGMIVVIACQGVLTHFYPAAECLDNAGDMSVEPLWVGLPPRTARCPSTAVTTGDLTVAPRSISDKRVWCVVDGLTSDATTETTRTLERVR